MAANDTAPMAGEPDVPIGAVPTVPAGWGGAAAAATMPALPMTPTVERQVTAPFGGGRLTPQAGLIAQEVVEACRTHSLPEEPILDKKWAEVDGNNEELLVLRYERIVPMLLGAVKELTNRVRQLEQQQLESLIT